MNLPKACDSHCPPKPFLISQTAIVLVARQNLVPPLEMRMEGLAKRGYILASRQCRGLLVGLDRSIQVPQDPTALHCGPSCKAFELLRSRRIECSPKPPRTLEAIA